MPVGAYSPNSYTGNGVTTVFPYSFRILDAAHLMIKIGGAQVLSGFTVSGVGNSSGGNVTFAVAPGVATITIERLVPYTRLTDYQANGDLREDTLDADQDAQEMQIQQIADGRDRAPTLALPIGSVGLPLVLPPPGAAQFLRWNAAGTALETADITGTGSIGIPVSIAQGGTSATTAAAARTALGLTIGTAAGNVITLDGSAKLPAVDGSQLTALAASITLARGTKCSITAASASATFTADEVAAELTVTGAPGGSSIKVASFSQAVNLATTGAGGMDTGTAPVSGYVAVYAIIKADGTKSALACAVATSSGPVYTGANMPTGYIYSCLLGILPTNGSSQFKPGLLLDRKFSYQTAVSVFSGTTGPTVLTSQSISSGVPAAARAVDVILSSTTTGANCLFAVAADATGTGAQAIATPGLGATANMPAGIAASGAAATFKDVPIITAQTIFWMESRAVTNDAMNVAGYGF